jgi:hypothetical protein
VRVDPMVALGAKVAPRVTVGGTGVGEGVAVAGVSSANWVSPANVAATLVATRSESDIGFACCRVHAAKRITRNTETPDREWVRFI